MIWIYGGNTYFSCTNHGGGGAGGSGSTKAVTIYVPGIGFWLLRKTYSFGNMDITFFSAWRKKVQQ